MTDERLLRLIPHLPDGVSENLLAPATERTPALLAAMPDTASKKSSRLC